MMMMTQSVMLLGWLCMLLRLTYAHQQQHQQLLKPIAAADSVLVSKSSDRIVAEAITSSPADPPTILNNFAISASAAASAAAAASSLADRNLVEESAIEEDDDDGNMSIHLENGYGKSAAVAPPSSSTPTASSVKGTPIYYPITYLAEPYKTTTIELLDWPEPSDEMDYKWLIDGNLHSYGRVIQVSFQTLGSHSVKVIAFEPIVALDERTGVGAAADVISSREFQIQVKYVRREIRKLTDADREAFFNAVAVMQRVPTSVGQMIYGGKYYSKDYFVRHHLYYGGVKDCDHWHQGSGFVTSHVAYTLMFEQSLQSINPSVSVPYWDFTMESTFYDVNGWRDSPVFSDDWFGNASPENGLHTPSTGRFAFTPAMTNARDYSLVTNSYGLMRAPWNADPTPFTTRFQKVYGYNNNIKPSGCMEYFLAMRKDNWMTMSKQLNSAAHGHIHETVGGSWNHNYSEEAGSASPAKLTFAHQMQAFSKLLWRAGFLTCPESCDMDTPWQDCQCTCSAEAIGSRSAYQVLLESKVLPNAEFFDQAGHIFTFKADEQGNIPFVIGSHSAPESSRIYKSMLHNLCNPGHIGDMFQATSPNDITFWVLHPTLDRLWHVKRLANDPSYDETWEGGHYCYGHDPTDLQPFKNLFGENETGCYYSNEELYNLLQPGGESLPYVYEHFQWSHCERLGYNMSPIK